MFKFFTTLSENEARNISPVTLAFVGDAVYTLYVRERLVVERDLSTGALQRRKSRFLNAAETQKNLPKAKALRFSNTTTQRGSSRFWAIYTS